MNISDKQIEDIIKLSSYPEWLSYLEILQDKIRDLNSEWKQTDSKDPNKDLFIKGKIMGLEFSHDIVGREKEKFFSRKTEK